MIPSFFYATSQILNGSLTFNGEEIVKYLKTRNTNKPRIKKLLKGFNYWELYNDLSKVVAKNKIKFFLYEKYQDNLVSDFSNYLKIDPAISIKLLKNTFQNRSNYDIKETPLMNSPLSIVCAKLAKNFKNPRIIFYNFNKNLLNMCKLMYEHMTKYKQKDKEIIKIKKEIFYKQIKIILNNSSLIKEYYRQDCLSLKKELKLDIDKYDYL